MKKIIYIILLAVLTAWTSFLFYALDVDFSNSLYKEERMVDFSKSKVGMLNYNFPYKEDIFFKIKTSDNVFVDEVTINGNSLELRERIRSKSRKVYYFQAPGEYLLDEENEVLLKLKSVSKCNIDIRAYNYQKKISEDFAILFPGNHIFLEQKYDFKFAWLFCGLFLFFILLKMIFRNVLSLPDREVDKKVFFLALIPACFFSLICFAPLSLGYRMVMKSAYLLTLYGAWISFYFVVCFLRLLVQVKAESFKKGYALSKDLMSQRKYDQAFFAFLKPIMNSKSEKSFEGFDFLSDSWNRRVKRWVDFYSQCDFSEKSIFYFLFFLFVSFVFLMIKVEGVSEISANIAYCFLIFATILKIFKLSKERKA